MGEQRGDGVRNTFWKERHNSSVSSSLEVASWTGQPGWELATDIQDILDEFSGTRQGGTGELKIHRT